jgi:Uma2 family endonuclease
MLPPGGFAVDFSLFEAESQGVKSMVTQTRVTAEEFDEISALPENADKRLEFIGGEIRQAISDYYASEVGATVMTNIVAFVKQNKLGRVTGADGGYCIGRDRYVPGGAFMSFARQPIRVRATYNPISPDLAIEVVSPSNISYVVIDKVVNYLAAGTVVWLFYPDEQEAKVYQPGLPVETMLRDGVLNGGNVLLGLQLPLKDAFNKEA